MAKKIQVVIFSLAIGLAFVLCATLSVAKASASSIDDWRPSCAIIQDIEYSKAKIPENEASIQFLQDMIWDYENNGSQFSDDIAQVEARYNYLHDYIYDQQKNIEDLTKLSYASYFAKTILEDVVGNDFAADNIFKWGFVDFLLSFEDDNITALLQNYYEAKDNLNEALSNEQRAEQTYNNAKADVVKLQAEIPALQQHIAYWEERLPLIYDIEAAYGAAGESNLAGDGYFCWPLQSLSVSSAFGEWRGVDDLAPNDAYGEYYYHRGVDLVATYDPVYAAGDGYATTGESESMGNYIMIEHDDGLVTIYMHLSEIFVPNGVQVHRGDNIAISGSTGDSTGPHLHFQVNKNGNPVDPFDYL